MSRWPKRLFVLFQLISMALLYLGPVSWEAPALLSDIEKAWPRGAWGSSRCSWRCYRRCAGSWGHGRGGASRPRLLQLVVGFQLPPMSIAMVRLYKVHELTAAHLQVLGTVCIGALFALWDLCAVRRRHRRRGRCGPQLGGQTLGLLGAAYGLLSMYRRPCGGLATSTCGGFMRTGSTR